MYPLLHLALRLWHFYDRHLATGQTPQSIGAWGERWAARYLTLRGCKVLERNARPCRHGELDLVAKRGKVYLFIEVKTRKNEAFGPPITAIHLQKRRRLRKCATYWLSHHHLLNDRTRYRFDAVQVVGTPGGPLPDIRGTKGIDMSQTRAPEL